MSLNLRVVAFRVLLPLHLAVFLLAPLLVHQVYARNGGDELGVLTPHLIAWAVALVAARLGAQFCCAPEVGLRMAARAWWAMWLSLLMGTCACVARARSAEGVLHAVEHWPVVLSIGGVAAITGMQHALFAVNEEVTVLILTTTLVATAFKIKMAGSLEYAALQALIVGVVLAAWAASTWALRAVTALQTRNGQLTGEKEKLQWEVASHHDGDWEDPREALGARVAEGTPHRTLGTMQDQAKTDAAVSCAVSFDHVDSSGASPTVARRTLIAPAPPKTPSSGVSLESSVMDTISQAAKKSPTRAPPPPKSRLPRPKKVCSEPSCSTTKPKAGNPKKPKRAVPTVERVVDLFEHS